MAKEKVLRWGARRRLQFIDFRLLWDGRFNRSDLSNTFGISSQQASADVMDYSTLAPGNFIYDRGERAFLRSPQFSPLFKNASAERYLLQLVAIENRWMTRDETWFDEIPPIENVALKRKATDPLILLKILDAIRDRYQFDMEYASLSGSPEGGRTIAPHALAHAAGRWYVRSWSREHNDFRDYNIDRIRSIGALSPAKVDPSLDFEWAHQIDLVVAPNPALPPGRQAAIAAEYGMVAGELKVPTRISLSFYLMAMHNLDVPAGILSAEKQQLVLVNRDEVLSARTVARKLSVDALLRLSSQ